MSVDFKEILLKLLTEDDDVKNAVKRIKVSKDNEFDLDENQDVAKIQQINILEEKIRQLTEQKEKDEREFVQKNKILEERNEKLLEENKALKQKYIERESVLSAIVEKYNDFKLRYSGLETVYSKYLELGDAIIKRMERILNQSSEVSETPELFMAYGVQENNIIALWESIATNFEFYESKGKLQDLVDIFLFFLELHKEISFKSILIDWPEVGGLYDERIHTRTSSSNVIGCIQKVILPRFSIGKSVMKKALVIVK